MEMPHRQPTPCPVSPLRQDRGFQATSIQQQWGCKPPPGPRPHPHPGSPPAGHGELTFLMMFTISLPRKSWVSLAWSSVVFVCAWGRRCSQRCDGGFLGCHRAGGMQKPPPHSSPRAGQPGSAPGRCSPSGFAGGDGERGSETCTPWLSPDPPTQHPPAPSPPQHRSPAALGSSPASPCPAPSDWQRQPAGLLSRPCPKRRCNQQCPPPQRCRGAEGPPLLR